ncbi:MAG: phosphate acyltransferase PlsX [Bacteroidia bacterium]|nr:MAG: phosphate acyltransferase PlsX [Bacteroidia bacterium]
MKIGIDTLGGDFAPDEIVLGSIAAAKEFSPEIKIVLIGDKTKAEKIITENRASISNFEFIHTTEKIEMGEHPAKAFSRKTNSSIALGYKMLHEGTIDGFASAGNTGAMLVGAMYTVKAISDIIRPSIAARIPRPDGNYTIILDVGLNADCKPEVLYQFGILGSRYANMVFEVENPKIGLLSLGSEEEKGNLTTRAAFQLMNGTKDFNFVGNIEGTDILNYEKVDVVVCDGFVGNVVLKQAEAIYTIMKNRNITDEYFDKWNFENFGGTPILGINAPVIIGHGVSKAKAVKNMLLHTKEVIKANLVDKFKEIFK